MSDNVNHPAHYRVGKIEVLEFITDQCLNFNTGQVVKYVCRAGHKNVKTHLEDLAKALFYLRWEIEVMNAMSEGRQPCKPDEMEMWYGPIILKPDPKTPERDH